jgi:hypothetical protein
MKNLPCALYNSKVITNMRMHGMEYFKISAVYCKSRILKTLYRLDLCVM